MESGDNAAGKLLSLAVAVAPWLAVHYDWTRPGVIHAHAALFLAAHVFFIGFWVCCVFVLLHLFAADAGDNAQNWVDGPAKSR